MDPDQLMRKLQQSMDSDDEISAERLCEIFAQREDVESFMPGDVIMHKYPNEATSKRADQPMVFVRYLPKPIPMYKYVRGDDMYSQMAPMIFDCEVAMSGGGNYCRFFMESRDFTRVDDES